MKNYALIVAGGSGQRMENSIPKQFLLVHNKPILLHTVEKFSKTNLFDKIILVLPSNYRISWDQIVKDYSFHSKITLVDGGNSRYESVKNGLKEVDNEGYVAIHDGVRPLVSESLIRKCMNELLENTSAVPSIPLVDSIRKVNNSVNEIANRNNFRIIQTPQCFHSVLLKKAYEQIEDNEQTDDASVFEKFGQKIHLVEGEPMNIKITVASDLLIAEAIINQQK